MPKSAKPRWVPQKKEWQLYHNGKYVYLCRGAANEAKAWELAAKIKDLHHAAGPTPKVVVEAIGQWLRAYGADWHKSILSPFIAYARDDGLEDVHAEYLTDYLLYLKNNGYVRKIKTKDKTKRLLKPYSASTMRRQLRFARKVLQWAHVRKFMTVPVPPLPPLPKLDDVDRAIDGKVLAEVFKVLPHRAKQVLALQILIGARPHEVTELKYEEIHGDVIELRRGKTFKLTGKTRIIHLNQAVKDLIEAQPTTEGYVFLNRNGTPHTVNGLRSVIRRAGKKVGVELSGSYLLRHTWAQTALDSGEITEAELGAALGHRLGSASTAVYARIRDRRTQAAVSSLSPILPADQLLGSEPSSSPAKKKRRKTDQRNRSKTARDRSRRQVG